MLAYYHRVPLKAMQGQYQAGIVDLSRAIELKP